MTGGLRVDHLVTSGTFSLDGDTVDVDNNIWLVGDDAQVLEVCFSAYDEGLLFSGDTLFEGGPGATGRSFSSFPTIVDSIRDRLLTLPPETLVHTGHGGDTSIGAEVPHLQEWLTRGH